jgi:hypothetical protein
MNRITDKDVEIEQEAAKRRLKNALARQGLAQLRLNEAAQAYETFANLLRHDPTKALLAKPDWLLSAVALHDYETEQRDVNKHIADLRILRVPKRETDEILQFPLRYIDSTERE